jgi:hypothetical protein
MPIELALRPGDVLVLRTPDDGGWWIRRRALMIAYPWQPWRWVSDRNVGKAGLVNHVAIYTHTDSTGRLRGLEGRPGGFGWVDLATYLSYPTTIANTDQPKTDEQRTAVVDQAIRMVGTPYDWAAILALAAEAAGLPFRLDEWPEDGVPGHVECASVADYLYEAAGLANPGGYTKTRGTDPEDWARFVLGKLWLTRH